jgi:molecular chaperone GrpE (heat shock protein)
MSSEKERRFGLSRFVKGVASEDAASKVIESRNADKNADTPETSLSVNEQLTQISDGMSQLFDLMAAMHEENNSRDKAFDTVYNELNEYKNNFVYERIKPFLRSLLFVFDSINDFNREVGEAESEDRFIHPTHIKANLDHIQEQLLDALAMVEVEMIQHKETTFNPRTQRAVEVTSVPPEEDNQVLKVVRHGWTIGGNNFRPADVVVGKNES